MTAVLNVVLLALAGLSILAAVYFILKGVSARSSVNRQAYSVGQVEAKRTSQVHWLRAAFLLLVGFIFIGIFAVRPLLSRGGASPAPTPPPTVESAPTQAPATVPPTLPAPTTGSTSIPPTPSPEVTVAPTPTSAPATATVSSGVGVWLRGSPSTTGQQLEWLLDGTIVVLMPGQETADDLLWQQVRTESGVEGWVASDFLAVNQPAP